MSFLTNNFSIVFVNPVNASNRPPSGTTFITDDSDGSIITDDNDNSKVFDNGVYA